MSAAGWLGARGIVCRGRGWAWGGRVSAPKCVRFGSVLRYYELEFNWGISSY